MERYLILFVTAILMGACSGGDRALPEPKSVYLVEPEGGEASRELSFTGVVKENDNISLGFKTPGQIKNIYVKEGARVARGQLLAVLDDEDYRLGVEALQIQYDQVKDEVGRAQRLLEKKSMTVNDYEKASAGLRQLAVQLQANKNKLAYTRLYAPVSGTIEAVNYSPSEMVDAGTPVFTMIGQGPMEVICDVTGALFRARNDIAEVFCCPGGEADSVTIPLKVLSIVPKADSNQLYRMRLGVDGGSIAQLTPGMSVAVKVKVAGVSESGLSLPASAIFSRESSAFVWVVSPDSTVTARKVTLTGTLNGPMVEVADGLTPDDHVVRAGVSMLHEGDKVKVIEKASATNVGGLL